MGNIPYNEVPEILQNALALPIIVDYGNNIGGKTGTLGNNKLFEKAPVLAWDCNCCFWGIPERKPLFGDTFSERGGNNC